MRHLIRGSLLFLFLIGPATSNALAATTASQLVELMRAGLGDDVLIALIETDGSTYQLSAADILWLHRQGLSDKVIRAMQDTMKKPNKASDREQVGAPSEPRSESQTIHQIIEPATPPVVNVYQTVTQRVEPTREYSAGLPLIAVPVAVPVYLRSPIVTRPAAPVYWGWGGQRRPDSWNDKEVIDPANPKTPDKGKGGG